MAHPSVLEVLSEIIHYIAAAEVHWCLWRLWTKEKPGAVLVAHDVRMLVLASTFLFDVSVRMREMCPPQPM